MHARRAHTSARKLVCMPRGGGRARLWGRMRTPARGGGGTHAYAGRVRHMKGADASGRAHTPVERVHIWVQGERTEVEGRARGYGRRTRLQGGGACTPVRNAHASGGAHTFLGGCARLWGGHTLGCRGVHGGGGARMGVGRARTPVQRHAVVVKGAPRGKASICKKSFLLNYP
jgi:hypothetical protein